MRNNKPTIGISNEGEDNSYIDVDTEGFNTGFRSKGKRAFVSGRTHIGRKNTVTSYDQKGGITADTVNVNRKQDEDVREIPYWLKVAAAIAVVAGTILVAVQIFF